MNPYSAIIELQRRTRFSFRMGRSIDLAVICVLGREPARVFTVKDVAETLDVSYHTAYGALRRLQLNRLVQDARLTDEGHEFVRIIGEPDVATATASAVATNTGPNDLY